MTPKNKMKAAMKRHSSKKNVRGTMKRRIAADKAKAKADGTWQSVAKKKKLSPWEKSRQRQRREAEKLPSADSEKLKKYEDKIPKSQRAVMRWLKKEEEEKAAAAEAAANTTAVAAAAEEEEIVAAKPKKKKLTAAQKKSKEEEAQRQRKEELKTVRRSKKLRQKIAGAEAAAAAEPEPEPAPVDTAALHERSLMDLVREVQTEMVDTSEIAPPKRRGGTRASASTSAEGSERMLGEGVINAKFRGATLQRGGRKVKGAKGRARDDDPPAAAAARGGGDDDDDVVIDDDDDVAPADPTEVLAEAEADASKNKTGAFDWSDLQKRADRPAFGEQAQAPPRLQAPKDKRALMPEHVKKKAMREMIERVSAGGPAELPAGPIAEAGARLGELTGFEAVQQAAREQYAKFKQKSREAALRKLQASQGAPSRASRRKQNVQDHSMEVNDFSY